MCVAIAKLSCLLLYHFEKPNSFLFVLCCGVSRAVQKLFFFLLQKSLFILTPLWEEFGLARAVPEL